jgi:Domain of unknown function (DUF1844)
LQGRKGNNYGRSSNYQSERGAFPAFLGQIPNPKTGQGEVNLDVARMFIDQLAMIQEKTRGNLTGDEATVLRNTLSNLQLAFVEVSNAQKGQGAPAAATAPPGDASFQQEQPAASSEPSAAPGGEPESKKKFTKSYGS